MRDVGNEGDFGVLILNLNNDEVDKEAIFFDEGEASNFWMKSRLRFCKTKSSKLRQYWELRTREGFSKMGL